MMTLLQLLQEFSDRRGLERPSVVMSTIDGTIRQARALLNEVIADIVERPSSWTLLQKEAVFVSVNDELQGTLDVIAPFGYKHIIADTFFDRSGQLPVAGPRGGPDWQTEKVFPTGSAPYYFREWQHKLYLQPTPPAGLTFAFEYASDFAIQHADGSYGQVFTADDDTVAFKDELLLAGLKWRWQRAQGMSYKQEFDDFEYKLVNTLGRCNDVKEVNLGDGPQSARPGVLVPYGNWNLP